MAGESKGGTAVTPRLAILSQGKATESSGADRAVVWWSFTKPVLAAAALALVRDGALALDETLPGRTFTLRQLLQHRSGLPDYGALADYHVAVARGDAPWRASELLARAGAANLRYAPGEGWLYSNIGYLYVRRRIEEASGQPLGAALSRLVLQPLGIGGVRLAETPQDLADIDGAGRPGEAPYHPGWVYHGLLAGRLADAALLLQRLLSGALLPPDLLAAMLKPHRLGGALPGRPWHEHGYGLGLMIGRSEMGDSVIGHTGAGPGSVIAVYCRPSAGFATAAAFAPDADEGAVERAAFRPDQTL